VYSSLGYQTNTKSRQAALARPRDQSPAFQMASSNTLCNGFYLDTFTALQREGRIMAWPSTSKRSQLLWSCRNRRYCLFGVLSNIAENDILTRLLLQVSPWMDNGNIRDYVRKNPDADRMRLLGEVASGACSVYLSYWPLLITPGMEFLHENGIIHGDLCAVSPCHICCLSSHVLHI
jgi:serine/threonine protein kinase